MISFIKEADKKRNVMWYAQSASPATKHPKFAKLAKKAGVKETFIPKFLPQYSICNYAEFIKNSTSPVTLYSEFHTAKLKNNLG